MNILTLKKGDLLKGVKPWNRGEVVKVEFVIDYTAVAIIKENGKRAVWMDQEFIKID